MDHNLVPEVHDVLNRITHSKVVVESQSHELPQKLALQNLFGEGDRKLLAAYFCPLRSSSLAASIHF